MAASAVAFVCRFPHGTGWVPAIVSLAGTRGGQDPLCAHPVSALATPQVSARAQPGADGRNRLCWALAHPDSLRHGHGRSPGSFSQSLLGANLLGILLALCCSIL